jgi:DNA-binding LacI/PurR family transcriptional regulator
MSTPSPRLLSAVDQTAELLRQGITSGRWKNHLPGFLKLAVELGVSRNTTVAAVARLIAEGRLAPAVGRCPHRIFDGGKEPAASGPRRLRTALLLMATLGKLPPSCQREAMRVMTELKAAGHECVFVAIPSVKDSRRIGHLARIVREVEADAWLVLDGTGEILRWFIESGKPVFALGGMSKNLPIASASASDLTVDVREAVRRFLELGHRRIVLVCNHGSRHPAPGGMVRAFREELQAAGIKPGEYNTPDWEETPEGLDVLLKSLFRVTPPTAIICMNLHMATGVMGFVTRMGLSAPADVSIVSLWQLDTLREWAFPGVRYAHFECDDSPCSRRAREWVNHVALGRKDMRRLICTSHLVEGTTMGPAKAGGPR